MSTRPSLSSIDLWGNHERRCLQVLRAALSPFALDDEEESEVDANRRLYLAIVEASHRIAREEGLESLPVVVPEGRNPPVPSDTSRTAREHKIPDFYWGFIDHLATDPASAARQFVVECKRLTVASAGWVYTEQYVEAGIARFITIEHSYGKEVPSGAMVGYVQLLTVDQALAEINACASKHGIPGLGNRLEQGGIVEFDHTLTRPFAISPFHLSHLWCERG